MSPEDSLGPCCACGRSDLLVRNIITLDKKSPTPGKGWGCVLCKLEPDGAAAVVCDECLDTKRQLHWACKGYPKTDGRVPMDSLTGLHEHNIPIHAEFERRS